MKQGKLSSRVLQMGFMKRATEKKALESEQGSSKAVPEIKADVSDSVAAKFSSSGVVVAFDQPAIGRCGRLSFKGANKTIEKLKRNLDGSNIPTKEKEQEACDDVAQGRDISDQQMAEALKRNKKRDKEPLTLRQQNKRVKKER